jgi:hypothetical protein
MDSLLVVGFLCAGALLACMAIYNYNSVKWSQMSPEERDQYRRAEAKRASAERASRDGWKNPQMVCPHCQTQGSVRTKPVTRKTGISGGKATAALLTGGASVLLTGLSNKENATQAHCDRCGCSWLF